ncbi:MAG: glycoside hydrolase family 32 protein, partial [Anaerolineae bacterium]
MRDFFYRPEGAWAADFIPFYDEGAYRLFYLLDWRDRAGHGEGTPWYQVSTGDFVRFTEHGEMLARGAADEQDLYVFTGSVFKSEGLYHIFYTGHNPHLKSVGRPEQGVMHAVSRDLLHWQKRPEHTFYAPTEVYEPHDWRDPFVFWNEEAKEYWMLLAARLNTGPSRRRGCTALCVSTDLCRWQSRGPFWAPGLYYTHECPDLFRMGEWWYLIFSEFSQSCLTRYRMSRSLGGPWLTPKDDAFDGRAYYAAKTASDGERRYLFGWNPTREGESDEGHWQWGGNLVVHEICQRPDGTLAVRVPESVERAFGMPVPVQFTPAFGECRVAGNAVELISPGSFTCATAGLLPERCRITLDVTFSEPTCGLGLMLRVSDDTEEAYYVRLEPSRNR